MNTPEHSAVARVLAGYCRCFDDARFADVAALFAPDAVLDAGGERVEGRAAIREFLAGWRRRDRPVRHLLSNTLIDLGSGVAHAESDFVLFRLGAAGVHETAAVGRYVDELVRGADGWRFATREISLLGDGPAGSAVADAAAVSPTKSSDIERGNVRGRATRERLIRTGERLFAEQGMNAVSLREIAKAAGQRNNATIDYHFGSREDLLAAIYAFRAGPVNERCLELGRALADEARLDDPGALLRALIGPHVESLRDPGNHFVRFLARALTEEGRLSVVFSGAIAVGLDAVGSLRGHLRACVPELSDEVFERRLASIMSWAVHRIAEFSREHPNATDDEIEYMFTDLVEMLVGALGAPHSD